MRTSDLKRRMKELERSSRPKLEAELRAVEARMRAREIISEWESLGEAYWKLEVVFWSLEGNPLCPDPETQQAKYNEAVHSQRQRLREVDVARELIGDDSEENEAADIALLRHGDEKIRQDRGLDVPGRWASEWEGDWRARRIAAWSREVTADELLDSMWRGDPQGFGTNPKTTWLNEILDPELRDFILEKDA